jgi:hypothetical protein
MKKRSIEAIQADMYEVHKEMERMCSVPYKDWTDFIEREWSDAQEHFTSLVWEMKRAEQ